MSNSESFTNTVSDSHTHASFFSNPFADSHPVSDSFTNTVSDSHTHASFFSNPFADSHPISKSYTNIVSDTFADSVSDTNTNT